MRQRSDLTAAFWSDMYTEDLSTASIGKHKSILTEQEVREIEARLEFVGKTFSYW